MKTNKVWIFASLVSIASIAYALASRKISNIDECILKYMASANANAAPSYIYDACESLYGNNNTVKLKDEQVKKMEGKCSVAQSGGLDFILYNGNSDIVLKNVRIMISDRKDSDIFDRVTDGKIFDVPCDIKPYTVKTVSITTHEWYVPDNFSWHISTAFGTKVENH